MVHNSQYRIPHLLMHNYNKIWDNNTNNPSYTNFQHKTVKPLHDTYVSIFIHFNIFSRLQIITKTLTLPMLGLPPMHVCFSSSNYHFPCARFLACVRVFLSPVVTYVSACFIYHDHPSFHFGVVPTLSIFIPLISPYLCLGIGIFHTRKGCTLPCGKKGLKAHRVKVIGKS
jgi:hypothetical protein